MADTMVKKIGGEEYNVLKLDGKPYAPVNQRVESAMKHGGYSILSCEFKVIFERQVCEVWLEVEGRKFCGTAEIKKSFTRPLEDAQTSAIGRALGFAGFDIERAIASAEDMASLDNASVTTSIEEAPPDVAELKTRAETLGIRGEAWKTHVCQATGKSEIEARKGLTAADRWAVKHRLDLLESSSQRLLEEKKHDGHMETLHAALAADPAN